MRTTKRTISLLVLAVMILALCMFAFAACGEKDDDPDDGGKTPVLSTERIKFGTKDGIEGAKKNPYVDTEWNEFEGLVDWDEKWENDPIYYVFEGSYSEAFQGDYSRTYMYMNCYEDGLLHGQYGRENYYGYWTNVNAQGEDQLVLHILAYDKGSQTVEYNSGLYESTAAPTNNTYYEYQSSIVWNQWGTRTVLIFGFHYSKVESITLDTTKVKTDYLRGENLNTAGLGVTVTRETGKSVLIEEVTGSYTHVHYSGYDPDKAGEQTITVTYDREEASATYKVNVVDIESVAIDVADTVKKDYKVGESFDASGITVNEVYENGVEQSVPQNKWTIEGFDTSKAGKCTVEISYGGQMKTFDITVTAPVYKNDDVKITVNTTESATVEFDGKTVTADYTIEEVAGMRIITLSAPEGGITGATEEEWAALGKQYTIGDDDSLAAIASYSLTEDAYKGISGGTNPRNLLIDVANGIAIVTYKYYYSTPTDTFVCEYTQEGNTVTLTKCISYTQEGSGATFEGLAKIYTINGNGTATPIFE